MTKKKLKKKRRRNNLDYVICFYLLLCYLFINNLEGTAPIQMCFIGQMPDTMAKQAQLKIKD